MHRARPSKDWRMTLIVCIRWIPSTWSEMKNASIMAPSSLTFRRRLRCDRNCETCRWGIGTFVICESNHSVNQHQCIFPLLWSSRLRRGLAQTRITCKDCVHFSETWMNVRLSELTEQVSIYFATASSKMFRPNQRIDVSQQCSETEDSISYCARG
jgi:hypothetical protein